ncbi:PadR family transcriptional regulator [Longimicrobium sp.]|jgi:DNA-binding PadR family transcriptional regulator|uniref:PadR family transcriptional regulator n=1 Tax=Longimicrobium sp. TaxID=2029185 RepID=UPI002ED8B06F
MPRPAAERHERLTAADLVVLGLLLERPMHGYEVNQELALREVGDWAGVSRPQVYYSLRKLADAGHIGPAPGRAAGAERGSTERGSGGGGPERRVFRVTAAGRRAYAAALARPEWATQRPPPPFLTWLVLATQGDPAVRALQLARRRAFLEAEAARERATLAAIRADTGPTVAVAELIVSFTIRQFEAELAWLGEVAAALHWGHQEPD